MDYSLNTHTSPQQMPQSLPSSAIKACTIVHIHVDTNRDGTVDDMPGSNIWTPGKSGSGAIICVNCDNDDNKGGLGIEKQDIADTKINGGMDEHDIAPLDLRRLGDLPLDNINVTLSVDTSPIDYRKHIRIFNNRKSGATEIIGPNTGSESTFANADFDSAGKIELGMEALKFPYEAVGRMSDSFDGYINLHLRVEDSEGKKCHSETVKIRVAPWIVFNHTDKTEKVYVVEIGGQGLNDNDLFFISEMKNHLGSKLEIIPSTETNWDRWTQDVMEIGFTGLPKSGGHGLPVAVRTPQLRGQGDIFGQYPGQTMLGPDFGYYETNNLIENSSLDSFGNLECSPPIPGYPFGRIVYGTEPRAGTQQPHIHLNMKDEMRALLEGGIQSPIHLNTGWLAVGHVDEFMSFIPDASGTHGFKIAFASPKLAMEIVKKADRGSVLFNEIKNNDGSILQFDSVIQECQHILADPRLTSDERRHYTRLLNQYKEYKNYSTVQAIKADSDFKIFQDDIQGILDAQKKTLKRELKISNSDFIDLPVLFTSINRPSTIGSIAFTPGCVNMLVVTESPGKMKLIIPKPFGPMIHGQCQFEKAIKDAFSHNGAVDPVFVDCFLTYHVLQGEIHCGTNSKRKPTNPDWWKEPV